MLTPRCVTRWLLIPLVLCAACSGQSKEQPARSPSYDYPPPGPTTADGDTIGADRQSTSDKLESGARVGSEGVVTPGPPTEEADAGAPR